MREQPEDDELTPEQEAFCTRNCCWSGHHKDCPRYFPPTPKDGVAIPLAGQRQEGGCES